jgi:polysaccharide deacetylase family protein (PEP-CTERM system associated)
MSSARPPLILTVDVEDWAQSTLDAALPLSDHCADNVERVLEHLGEFPEARATFFVLGLFAEKHPGAVKAIFRAGHEIASHGYGHVEIFRLDRQAFAEDLRRSTELISDTVGARPNGYRAPDFSMVGETLWALEVLAEQQYQYDSSIFPMDRGRYGIAGWPRGAGCVALQSGARLLELPLTTLELFGRRWPMCGGGYARLLPKPVLVWALRKAAGQLDSPPVFYCHPYEFDPGEFERLEFCIPRGIRLHQGLGRRGFAAKFRSLLRRFECLSVRQALERLKSPPVIDYKPYVLTGVQRPPVFRNVKLKPRS